tara:strand:- start:496 stop:597 length:102 start_codon:yes stop_codon:yes gene_type:complete
MMMKGMMTSQSVKQYDDEKETSRSWFQREVSQA